MRVAITGSDGFLGRHLKVRLRALCDHDVVGVSKLAFADDSQLRSALLGAQVVVHLAGINRDTDDAVEFGNAALAQRLETVAEEMGVPTIIYANSIQSDGDSPYGRGKRGAADTFRDWSVRVGGTFVDLILPNVFGEGGRPRYNSFVATFCQLLATGGVPHVDVDRTVSLIHAQDVAALIIDHLGARATERVDAVGRQMGVSETLRLLQQMSATYETGQIPRIDDPFSVALFNTYRSYLYPAWYPRPLDPKQDSRGTFVELIRSESGQGQSSYSTTHPGITRGNHFHLRKIERFVVIEGEARIALRPVGGTEVPCFAVSGQHLSFVDMPTLHTHNITNTGSGELVTMFWINEIYDPADPDTFAEAVT